MPWVEREEQWHHTEVRYCEVTGQLLPRRHWVFEHEGRRLEVRDPHAEELFRRYLVGPPGRAPG